jgi:hypothetical protein
LTRESGVEKSHGTQDQHACGRSHCDRSAEAALHRRVCDSNSKGGVIAHDDQGAVSRNIVVAAVAWRLFHRRGNWSRCGLIEVF